MRLVLALLVVAAIGVSLATAALILRLPDPPGPDDPDYGVEVQRGTHTKQNSAKRNDYLLAGGLVVVTLLGSAAVLAVRRPRP